MYIYIYSITNCTTTLFDYYTPASAQAWIPPQGRMRNLASGLRENEKRGMNKGGNERVKHSKQNNQNIM